MNIELRNVKKDCYTLKIAGQKHNPKEVWKTINNLLGKQNKQTAVNELYRYRRRYFNKSSRHCGGFQLLYFKHWSKFSQQNWHIKL